ncbi:MAG: presqualene diphosphate synthase HpnD [Brachymonas sp.]
MAEVNTPQSYVAQKTAASGSRFYYAFLFLPKDKRAAMTAFYAFCRVVDDIVDEVSEPQVAAQKLAWWRADVEQSFAADGAAHLAQRHPVLQALLPHCARYGITREHLFGVIQGCQMDLEQNRYWNFASLEKYCYFVAGLVGEVIARILGFQHQQTMAYAHKLGLALQLTNIIRDVGEDADRGRIYLPVEDLERFAVPVHEINQKQYSERFTALMQFQAQRAQALYDEALGLLPAVDFRAQKPGLMMAAIYRNLLREVEKDGFAVLHQRTSLTPLRKLWLAWKVQALGQV